MNKQLKYTLLFNISRSKGSRTMKFGQLIEYIMENIFLRNAENEAGRLVPDLCFIFLKSFIWGKGKWSVTYFQYISIALNVAYKENKLYKILDYWSKDMLNFDFLEKGLGKSSSLGNICIAIVCLPGCYVIWKFWN